MRLKDKIALIIGSARGIGQATAELFHIEGATVIVSDIRDEEGDRVVRNLKSNAYYLHLDVGSEQSWQQAAEYISENFGRLDILVNNAGITGFLESAGPWDAEQSNLSSWNEVHRVTSTGVMLGCKYAIMLMKEKGGSIVNISSRSGIVGTPGQWYTPPAKRLSGTTPRALPYIVPNKDTTSEATVFIQQPS